MKTLQDLPENYEELCEQYKKECMNGLYEGHQDKTNKREDTVEFIEEVYKIAGFQKPVVIIADNPNSYKHMFHEIPRDQERIARLFQLKNEGKDIAEYEMEIESRLEADFLEKSKVEGFNLEPARSHWLYFCSEYSRAYYMFYYFIHKELDIPFSMSETLEKLYKLSIKSFTSRCFFTENFVLVLRNPKRIHRNEIGFNNPNGPAILFRGEYGMYYINGRRLSREMYEAVANQTFTFDDFTKINNEDVKSAVIGLMEQRFGLDYVGNFLSERLVKVDTYVHEKDASLMLGTTQSELLNVYDLLSFRGEGLDVKYVRCYCPSTDRMFLLPVESRFKNAKDAIASLYRVPRVLKPHIKSISRQGERFSTTFSGIDLDTITKEQVEDLVAVSGDEYFGYLSYEY